MDHTYWKIVADLPWAAIQERSLVRFRSHNVEANCENVSLAIRRPRFLRQIEAIRASKASHAMEGKRRMEFAEKPVVGNQARVEEEVRVGEDVSERRETAQDTVRGTEINLAGASTPAPGVYHPHSPSKSTMRSDPCEPQLDKRALVIGIVVALVLALFIWFLQARSIRTGNQVSQPLIPQTRK